MNSQLPTAQRDRNRALLVLIVVLFLGSALVAGALRFSGWRPTGMQNKGELLDPPADARISTQEVFGPALAVYRYDDLDEAIARANALPTAFQASVFARSKALRS